MTTTNRWYHGVTGYQWLVLLIASAGWVFDIYEGQIFNLTRNDLLKETLGPDGATPENIKYYGDVLLGVFLLGGALGGMLFGSLADRWGRRPTMVVTILMYSIFSGLTYFAQSVWQVGVLRFLVAMGVGGEWAVAATLVAEVFPPKARAHASGIFHATSVLGTWLAAVVAMAVAEHWRFGYIFGVLPALLILWVRASIREPELWKQADAKAHAADAAAAAAAAPKKARLGSFQELLGDPRWRMRAILGMLLAAVGLGSFWAVNIAGQDLAREMLVQSGEARTIAAAQVGADWATLEADAQDKEALKVASKKAKFAYGIVETAGGGIGLIMFGPLCVWLGRRRAFMLMQLCALLIVPITCYAPANYTQLLVLLPFYGFFTLGIHAGYAVYFPELFPTRLRGTGAGFCFNGGRVAAASMLWLSGVVKAIPGMELRKAVSLLGLSFALGIAIVWFMPETKNQPLPE